MAGRATKRITICMDADVHATLLTAAERAGTPLYGFTVGAALGKAERVIKSESQVVLTRKGSLWLLQQLDSPPPRNAKFKAVLEHYRRVARNALRAVPRP